MSNSDISFNLSYQSGFGNQFASEALPKALTKNQNSPQKAPYGLYTEQISGSAFTAPRDVNYRSWLYRIRPSANNTIHKIYKHAFMSGAPFEFSSTAPNQLRWDPLPFPDKKTDFIDGLVTIAANGNVADQYGMAVHLYSANASMRDRYFSNSDGEFLFVPQTGSLLIFTELGKLAVNPGELAVIPKGICFRIDCGNENIRGYICENYGNRFQLPELGPIGANGLANAGDFLSPTAAFEDIEGSFQFITKFMNKLWVGKIDHSPLDVVAWKGNYAPYKYDLSLFNVMNTVSYDHPDPSIFTVLTSASEKAGTANIDFVIFPPRWSVAEHTFRPPWFHRNIMSEYMGLIKGTYDAKAEGFIPGGGSLHNSFTPHGPDKTTFEKALRVELKPQYIDNTLAFMFESRYVIHPTKFALTSPQLQKKYADCWKDFPKLFNGKL